MQTVKSILKNSCLDGIQKDFNVNQFFFVHDCFLKIYKVKEPFVMVGSVINHWCKAYNINQKLILVTLQREMGLISKTDISEVKEYTRPTGEKMYPLDWACGCGVPDGVTANAKYKGFENQIMGACSTYRRWFNVFKDGMPCELLDKDIKACIPESAITLSLLKYTPHISALTTTERIYTRYFPEVLDGVR